MLKYHFSLLLVLVTFSLHSQCPTGDVFLSTQAEVDSFAATYPTCQMIMGNLKIGPDEESADIVNLNGLANLNTVTGFLLVENNSALTGIGGLSSLTTVGEGLLILNNPALNSLIPLTRLTSLGGSLRVNHNGSLPNLLGLTGVTEVPGDLNVDGNASMMFLLGLNAITSVSGEVQISQNPALGSLTGLDNLASIGERLLISDNPMLVTLGNLSALESIGGGFTLALNASLPSLEGLSALGTIGGSLVITDHAALSSLEALSNLTSIGDFLQITFNPALTSLSGLDNIEALTISNLFIQGNTLLTSCAVESICVYLVEEMEESDISANAEGCKDEDEVVTACISSTDGVTPASIALAPNPTAGQLQLRDFNAERVDVFTPQGQRVATYQDPAKLLDLSTLPSSVYYLHLLIEGEEYVARVVKM
ncbi:MAG: hypothetical protein AAFO03_01650 [Bacteroidota bacterium]